jgi:hypothetical protein
MISSLEEKSSKKIKNKKKNKIKAIDPKGKGM